MYQNQWDRPRRKKSYPIKATRPTLISQIEAKIGSGKGAAYDQKLKVVKLKSMAETLLFIQKHDFADFDALSDYADAASGRTKELTAKIKAAENRMAEIAVLKTHIINYAKTRDIYTGYRKAGYSKNITMRMRVTSSSTRLRRKRLTIWR